MSGEKVIKLATEESDTHTLYNSHHHHHCCRQKSVSLSEF